MSTELTLSAIYATIKDELSFDGLNDYKQVVAAVQKHYKFKLSSDHAWKLLKHHQKMALPDLKDDL